MPGGDMRDPRRIAAILAGRWTWRAARIGPTGADLLSRTTRLIYFPAAIAEQEGLDPVPGRLWASLAIAVELIGSILVIVWRWVWLGAGAFGVRTAIAAFVANNFRALHGRARFVVLNSFLEHVSMIAGLVIAAMVASYANRGLLALQAPCGRATRGEPPAPTTSSHLFGK
ncbi:MAG TPA: DoxX family protein [Stellaceae bacterium]|nr:DoxX family protein [Stellaceae bacterium]